jgi:plasmid stabilization system protein ParE
MSVPKRHPLAKADIEREARWYEERKPGLGDEFVEEVNRIIRVIGEQPFRYSIRFSQWRRANLSRFPHAVFYQVFDTEPVVFAVLHAKQDHPGILEGRQIAT